MADEKIILIAAIDEGNVIGKDNEIPWPPFKGDLKRFRDRTMGHAVLMGRKTAEHLEKHKFPLDGRLNVIVSRSRDYSGIWDNVVSARDLEMAIGIAANYRKDKIFYGIGGGEIYNLLMPRAFRLDITKIPGKHEGDAFFPAIGSEWREVFRETRPEGHSFLTYEI